MRSVFLFVIFSVLIWNVPVSAQRFDDSVYVDRVRLQGNCRRYIRYFSKFQQFYQFKKFDRFNRCTLQLTIRETSSAKRVVHKKVALRQEGCHYYGVNSDSCRWKDDALTNSLGQVRFNLRGYQRVDNGCGFFLDVPVTRKRYSTEEKCDDFFYGELKEIYRNGQISCLEPVHKYPYRFLETYRNCNYP